MTTRFDAFVLFAEMRTGSNFLEANLNAFEGLNCHGEAFNPHFIGYPGREEMLCVTQAERDRDPTLLLQAIRDQDGLAGFRFFHDHDPRILPQVLDDPRIAKIVLTRNPVDSYVSWKIAQATGQWKLTNVGKRKEARVRFDAAEFEAHLDRLQGFQRQLLHALQTTGQTAFYVAYEDLQDVSVMNGLAAWLGCADRKESLNTALKRQNPEPMADKVENLAEMHEALARLDRFDLSRTPTFEPRRGPAVPGFVAAARTPLLYMPIRSGPERSVRAWLAALDGVGEEALPTDFRQNALRQWMRERPRHRSFAVIRHPLARAHDAFCTKILPTGPGAYLGIRKTLRRAHELPLPEDWPDDGYDLETHRAAFTGFLAFLKANLQGQTGVRVDAFWASQAACLEGMAQFALPARILREDEMATGLPELAREAGHAAPPVPRPVPTRAPYALAAIHDDRMEALAQDAYERDYVMFGFDAWG